MKETEEMDVRPGIDDRRQQAESAGYQCGATSLAVIVPMLNESEHLPTLLESIDSQTRRPDRLILVDDGSTDGTYEVAQRFAGRAEYAVAVRRPPRPPEDDRLATAAELRAFQWGLSQLDDSYDVVAKLDADLELSSVHFAEVLRLLERDERLGVAGAYLSIRHPDGSVCRERHPQEHVRGPNKFYRRACLKQISPLPAHLGWDSFDEAIA